MSTNGTTGTKPNSREREYVVRNSILTEKLNNADIQIIYNLFFVILVSLIINSIITEYITTGQINFGQKLIQLSFTKMHVVAISWCFFNSLVLVTYLAFQIWARMRVSMLPKDAAVWDKIWITIIGIYYTTLFFVAQKIVFAYELSPGSSMIILSEHVRLLMKQHSFIRENAPKVINYKPHSDKELELPKLGSLIYFVFAPVLIYRDEYPRTKEINWKFAFRCVGEVFFVILLVSLLSERFLNYSNFCLKKFTWKKITVQLMSNLFPGMMFMLCGFYSILHATQNAFAEVLRFGDRLFYREWWASTSLSQYFRDWNIIVHDWLFHYIYREVTLLQSKKRKIIPALAVFIASGLVHEWIISVSFNLFFPVQFSQLIITGIVFGMIRLFDKNIGNVTILYSISLGSSIQITFYAMEFFARINCPVENESFLDFFKPRFLTCNCTI